MIAPDPYSASRIARGVIHLVGGKAITSIAGIGTFLLLVRSLPVEQFAAYTILFALVELIEALTGVGLSHVVARYVPEVYLANQRAALRRIIGITLALRMCVLLVVLGLIHLIAPTVAPLVGLEGSEWALQAYLAVVLLRIAAMALFNVLESMLHQAVAQLGFGLVTALRFVLLAWAASYGGLDLKTVIVIELLTDGIGVGVMLIGLIRATARGSDYRAEKGAAWVKLNRARMIEFGLKGYLQNLLIMPFGGSVNRLLVGGSLATSDVALFGFANAVADLMQRYLPVRLLAGVIRPVLTARYVRDRRFADLELAANVIFKINAFLICLASVVIFGGGEQMISLVSAGKYSEGSVGLLLLMCALVMFLSLRHMLDHVSHAVERNGPLIWSNALITLSVLPGIALLPVLGVHALPAANLVGLMAGSALLIWRLHVEGFDYHQDLRGLARMLLATMTAFGSAELSRMFGSGWIGSVAVSVAVFLATTALVRPWVIQESRLVVDFARQTLNRRRSATPAP